jgi:menaquinone-dependent protoporphyrinogen oxidase
MRKELEMKILVTYASKHGATQGIAERIARTLREVEQDAVVLPIAAVGEMDLSTYEAFVIGSAAYYFHWMKEATQFVRRHQATLVQRPVWLFSSGPLGPQTTDAQGRDVRVTTEPKEFAALRAALHPRDARVFFGALDASAFGFPVRVIAARLPQGDFRDWDEIDAWAEEIAHALAPAAATMS